MLTDRLRNPKKLLIDPNNEPSEVLKGAYFYPQHKRDAADIIRTLKRVFLERKHFFLTIFLIHPFTFDF